VGGDMLFCYIVRQSCQVMGDVWCEFQP
jgi:hypothetical protein